MRYALLLLLAAPVWSTTNHYQGTFAVGDATVTVPFQPKAMRVRGSINTTAGQTNNANVCYGFATPGGGQYSFTSEANNGEVSGFVSRKAEYNDSACMLWSGATVLADFQLGSCSSTTCNLTWRTSNCSGCVFDFLIYGGSTVSAAVFGISGTGAGSTKTIGFQSQMEFILTNATGFIAHGTAPTASTGHNFAFGWQIGSSASYGGFAFSGTTSLGSVVSTTNPITLTAGGAAFQTGKVTAVTSTDITYTGGGGGSPDMVAILALADSGTTNWNVGSDTVPTAAAPQTKNLTTTGTPGLLDLASINRTTALGTVATASDIWASHGVFDGYTKNARFWSTKTGNPNPSVAISEWVTDHILMLYHVATGATLAGSASTAVFTPTNVAITFDDTTAAQADKFVWATCDCIYVAIGSSGMSGRRRTFQW